MYQLHGSVVNIHVLQLNIGILGCNAGYGLAPDAGGLEYVGLIYAGDLLGADTRHFKCTACDALYLIGRVVHIVAAHFAPTTVTFLAVVVAKVDVTGQLTANNHVEAVANDFLLDRAGISQRLVHHRWANICEQTERCAQTEQCLLRTLCRRHIVPLGAADGAEQNRVCIFADFDCLIGQRNAICVDGAAAGQNFLEFKGVTKLFADLFQNQHSLGNDFRTDTVTLDDCNIVIHGTHSPLSFSDLSRPPAWMMD